MPNGVGIDLLSGYAYVSLTGPSCTPNQLVRFDRSGGSRQVALDGQVGAAKKLLMSPSGEVGG